MLGETHACELALADLYGVSAAGPQAQAAIGDALAVDANAALLDGANSFRRARRELRELEELRDRQTLRRRRHRHLGHVLGQHAMAEALRELLLGSGCSAFAMEAGDDFPGEGRFDVARVARRRELLLPCRGRPEGQELDIAP